VPLSSGFTSGDLLQYAIRLRRRPAIAYPVLVAAIAAATLTRWLLDGQVVAGPFVTYYPIIIIAALIGGFWTGLVSISVCAVLGWYVFLSAASPLLLETLTASTLLLFFALSLLNVALVTIVNNALIRLSEQERNVRSLVEALPSGVMVINNQGIIAHVNAAAERVFGYPRNDLIGMPALSLVPDRFRVKHRRGFAAYLENPEARGLGRDREFKGKRRDGSEVSIEVGLTPIERSGKRAVVATVIDISERIRAREQETLLTQELQHRTQNLFAVIQAIVGRTLVGELSLNDAKQQLTARLNALAGAHNALTRTAWEGVSLAKLLERELGGIAPNAIAVTGCDILVSPSAAQQFALIFHELATNAFKYGALSLPSGRIAVSGLIKESAETKQFIFRWAECGGPLVPKPARKGFGSSILIEAAQQFGMIVGADFEPRGLIYSLVVPVEDIEASVGQVVPFVRGVAEQSTPTPT